MEHSPGGVVLVDDFVLVIDMSAKDSAGGRAALAKAIGRSCETSGFFTIVGHGVSRDLVDRMHATTNAFFTQPDAEKQKVANVAGGVGFRPFGGVGGDG